MQYIFEIYIYIYSQHITKESHFDCFEFSEVIIYNILNSKLTF